MANNIEEMSPINAQGIKLLHAVLPIMLDESVEPLTVLYAFDLLVVEMMGRLLHPAPAVEHLRMIADTWERNLLAGIPTGLGK